MNINVSLTKKLSLERFLWIGTKPMGVPIPNTERASMNFEPGLSNEASENATITLPGCHFLGLNPY